MVLGVLWALRPQEGARGHAVPWTHTHELDHFRFPFSILPNGENSQALVTDHRDSSAEHGAPRALHTPHREVCALRGGHTGHHGIRTDVVNLEPTAARLALPVMTCVPGTKK